MILQKQEIFAEKTRSRRMKRRGLRNKQKLERSEERSIINQTITSTQISFIKHYGPCGFVQETQHKEDITSNQNTFPNSNEDNT